MYDMVERAVIKRLDGVSEIILIEKHPDQYGSYEAIELQDGRRADLEKISNGDYIYYKQIKKTKKLLF